ncbi:zinc-ribbon domain-containing protein [Radiobacillus kanasensis]|uniref:zinc ribbon domain-containing protein n=1 Tax=Radiobacillus kanasensis TaxID=2844358 RepID=UPI001E3D2D1E|nr:zinc ribbon domain-containing protein [Radiobacillus kanasensis]UFU00860.1 zinc-ribbon domain-containing protein [Radiobacillus kanasensis]
MLHCPYCGNKVQAEESFCFHCGRELPQDLFTRSQRSKKERNKRWFPPLITLSIIILVTGVVFLFTYHQESKALEAYEEGHQKALEGQYKDAQKLFNEAIDRKQKFPAASISLEFTKAAQDVEEKLLLAKNYSNDQKFQESLTILQEAEKLIKNYNGKVVNQLISTISSYRKAVQYDSLTFEMDQNPSYETLKNLLWKAEEIQTEEAKEIAEKIQEQIISYAYSTATKQLQDKHFTDARAVVNDALKYAPESEKLLSLKTTIEKEKIAFETSQEARIEQALTAAEEEKEKNKEDAVELVEVHIKPDNQGNLVVSGRIKSVATVPINSVAVEYELLNSKNETIATNDLYTFPETVYPDEEAQFEFTHYDIKEKPASIKIKIKKIKWFID